VLLACGLPAAGCGDPGFSEGYLEATARRTQNQVINEVRLRARQLAPTEMRVDLTDASERERRLLEALLRAAGLADEIFWRQTAPAAMPYRAQVRASHPRDHIVREFYMLQRGPYDRLDEDRPYMDVPPKPPGAGFYPPDLTADEFRAWLEAHPEDRAAFLDPHTVIRRPGEQGEEELTAVPYHEEYRELTGPLADALREAASHAGSPRLERFLELKARAVLTGDHVPADTAWVRLADARFDVVVGPYELREDGLLGLKAAYGASVALVDDSASSDLDRYGDHLAELEAALPYPDSLKADSGRPTATFSMVRDIYRGGLIGTGRQPVAATLPVDPGVRAAAGTKTIVWQNLLDARYDSIVAPIAREAVAREQRDALSREAYLDLVVTRGMGHVLGPRSAATDGGRVPASRALGELHSWVEEARAGAVGLLAMEHLSDRGELASGAREGRLVAHLADLLRAVRFGDGSPQGRAALVSLDWHLRNGGVSFDGETARYRVVPEAIGESARGLARELSLIQAAGDRARAERLHEDQGEPPPSLETVLTSLGDLPVEVAPHYRIRW
jgi:hypothetical protein